MKTLEQHIQEILTPKNSIGFIKENRIYQLQPLMPVEQYLEMVESLDPAGQKKMLGFLGEEKVVIFNNILHYADKGLNFQGRLKEILAVYNQHIRKVVGDKKALIDLYDQIPVEDIANLTEDHVIFVMKTLVKNKSRALAAIRYLPPYEIHFERSVFYMPGCTIAIHIDNNLKLSNPEVIPDSGEYEHPFVYRGSYTFGQKICLGSYYDSNDQSQVRRLRFANRVNNLIKQSVQILISGYNRHVTPANGHLHSEKYGKYKNKK